MKMTVTIPDWFVVWLALSLAWAIFLAMEDQGIFKDPKTGGQQ